MAIHKAIAILTANLGNFDPEFQWADQEEASIFKFTDENFPPRTRTMSPRLQARIVKMFGWQLRPGFDFYIWVDASFTMSRTDSTQWFIDQCQETDTAFFLHPDRHTIRAEANYIKRRVAEGNKYLASRYANEFLDEQMEVIESDTNYQDDTLYASCAFVYRNNSKVREMLEKWWVHTSRFHAVDQLSLPFVLRNSGCTVNNIKENIYKIPHLTFTRNKRHE